MTDQAVQQCVDRLNELAQDPRFSSRSDDLMALARDIATPDGDSWADVNLFAAFPPETTARLRHPNLLEGILGVLAGVSVFLPVAWTWISFHSATDAYERMISENAEPEGRTFLSLWATGFGGRLRGWHELVPMGMVSVVLICVAILSIVVHRLVAAANVRREESAAQEAHSHLISALTHAQLILSTRRANHPLRVEGIIKSSMKKLREAHEAARQVIADLAVTSATVSSSVGDLVESAKRAGEDTKQLITQAAELQAQLNATAQQHQAAVTNSLSAVDSAVTSSMSSMEQSVTASVRAAQESLDASGRQLGEDLRASLANFESTMGTRLEELRDDAVSEIHRAGESLHGVVDGIGASAARNATAAGELSEQITAMTDDNATTRSEFIAAIADVRSAVEGIESALLRHESSLQGQASELSGARDAAERMLRRLTVMSGTDGVVTGA